MLRLGHCKYDARYQRCREVPSTDGCAPRRTKAPYRTDSPSRRVVRERVVTLLTSLDLQEIAEGYDLEVKRATGRDGRGELPRSFFESYVAMANTEGGVILLGVEEKPRGVFTPVGIAEPDRVLTALWNGLNDRDQVSENLLMDRLVTTVEVAGHRLIRVQVPRARRSQRPVFVGKNPLEGTFRRNYDGDYRCDHETVKRMLAEQVEDERDGRILEGFTFDDLDEATFRAYRNQFRAARREHPWHDEDDLELLRLLGGWRRDRQSGQEGLTIAGLLMFGKLPSILEAVPHYVVDYQERLPSAQEIRWVDRITTDGTWSGNLYDFYRRTIQRLFDGLKVPFRLVGDTRVDETPVHVALREALVNALIHADYTGRPSILVVKQPGLFGFRNPGTMRLPLEDAIDGGMSDCRNRNLQKMFQLAGLGEQAGSGIPRIFGGWRQQHWRSPELFETMQPEQTILTLLPISLLPEDTVEDLDRRFGPAFQFFSETQRLALATVMIEGQVTHARLRSMTSEHPYDLTKALSALVRAGHLESTGASRGTVYFFPGDRARAERNLDRGAFAFPEVGEQLDLFKGGASQEAIGSLQRDLESSQQESGSLQQEIGSSQQDTSSSQQDVLLEIAKPVRERQTAPQELVETTILCLCTDRFLTLRQLARLLNRDPGTLRNHYLSRLIRTQRLILQYPEKPSHPKQAYTTRSNG
jgi:ATP-dependent DNA helicase RecG